MRNTFAAHRRTRTALAAALIAASLALPQVAAAGNRSFSPGSIIIPAQMEYQDGDTNSDGTIAAYGLIYTVLTKNKARLAAGKRPITFYWAVEPRKLSHHRCRTSTDTLPNYNGYNDNDGCDFAVQSANGQPVVAIAQNFTETSNFTVNDLGYSNGQVSRSGTFTIGASKKVVKYSGGGWIVDAVDRNDFLLMLQQDAQLAHFHKNGPGRFYVKMHSAQASFEAYIQRAINQRPPLLAVVGKGTEQILTDYLDQAGLSTAFGNTLGGTPSLPNGVNTHGDVYDVLDPLTHFVSTADYPCGAINVPADPLLAPSKCSDTAVSSFYKVLWAADWKIDSGSTYPAEWSGNQEGAQQDALDNISSFVDRGNGLFAEDSSITTFEGISVGAATTCSTMMACYAANGDGTFVPFECPSGSTPSRCDGGAACYSCPTGEVLDDSTCPGKCVPQNACPSGYQLVNGACYACAPGYTLNTNNPNALSCMPDGAACPAGYTPAAGGCYQCPVIANTTYLLDAQPGDVLCHAPCAADAVWDTAVNGCVKNSKVQNTKTAAAITPPYASPTKVAASSSTAATKTSPLPCPSTDVPRILSCGPTGGIVEGGSDATRFQTTGGVKINSISGTFSGTDCNDFAPTTSFFHATAGATGSSCVDYHPDDRVTALLFSQKGNFNFTSATGGNVQDFTASSPSMYRDSTWNVVSSARVDSSGRVYRTGTNAGFDFATMRHKDGDPQKGLVVYLSGHQYKFDFWGLRIILNTLLNLGLNDGDTELARSEPVGFRDPDAVDTADRDLVFQGTYNELAPPLFNDWREYSPVSPESWRFPYTKGHLHAYRAGSIATSGQDFVQNQLFDAARVMPLPGARKIFTVLGGSAHLGWKRVWFDYTETRSGCTDLFGRHGECDLVEKLAEGGTAGVTLEALRDGTATAAKRALLGMFVQQVKGFCAAFDSSGSPIFEPTNAQCKSYATQKNVAVLGGIDHSSPAVVGKSKYVTYSPYDRRPIVAYAGGRDGMLHAFYVGGGAGFPGMPEAPVQGQELWAFIPPGQLPWLATNNAMVDAAINVIDVFGDFPTDDNGDGTIDWTAERERPDGIREWRTVLLAAAGQESKNLVTGQGGLELFAMDVTNPLKPVLLWHVTGISEKDGRWDANGDGVFGRDATTGQLTEVYDDARPKTYAMRWRDWDDGKASTVDIPAKYEESDPERLRAYHTGRYDYSNLGFTYGTAVGKVWSGNSWLYLAYIATSSVDFNSDTPSGFPGLEVFALDLVTGQKVWQWERLYTVATTDEKIIAANDIPGRPALADVNADGSVDRIYVGDLEGRMWELAALDGRNLNYWPVKSPAGTFVSLPLFGTPRMVGAGATDASKLLFRDASGAMAQQPLTSPIGLGRLSETTPELRQYLQGRLAVVQGTMGVNWALAPFEKGNVFVLPSSPEAGTRIPLPSDGLDLASLTGSKDPRKFGVIHRADAETTDAFWTIELGVGERVYGMPRIANNKVVFDTAFGDFTGDQLSATAFESGNLFVASKDGNSSTPVRAKSFAGVLIFGDNVIVTSATGIMRFGSASAGISEGGFSTRAFNRSTPAIMKTWELRGEIVAPDLR